MSKAAELAALIGSQTALSNRNLIINGAMQVAQRGTSSTSLGYQTVDRFNVHKNGSFDQLNFTQTQVTDAPAGFSNSYKFTTTTAETAVDSDESIAIRTAFEGQDLQQLGYGTGSAKKLTLSFYVKSSQTGTFAIYFYSADTVRIITRTYTISSANTWEQKSVTIDGDASGSIDNDANESLQISWAIAAGSNFTSSNSTSWSAYSTPTAYFGHAQNAVLTTTNATWQITGVQLEVGEQATPFEHRSFGDELARCQRYFLNYADVRNDYGMTGDLGTGSMYNSSILMCCIRFPVEMRTAPTMTHGSGTDFYRFWRNGAEDKFNGWTYWYDANRLGGALQSEANISGTAGHAGRVMVLSSAGDAGYIHLDAEL